MALILDDRRPLALALASAIAACAPAPPVRTEPTPTGGRPTTTTATPATNPVGPATTAPRRLVVLLVIDQLPAWAFAAKQPALTGGFARLLSSGTWHVGHHPTPATLTAPGHALLGTGQTPDRTGIIANTWWDRTTETQIRSIDDGKRKSAVQLRVPALGDAIASANTQRGGPPAHAVGISLKDRAAILPIGHAGTSIWYEADEVAFTSTQPRPWLTALGRAQPIAAHLHDVWTPLDPARLASLTGTLDDQPGELGEKGFGPTFPHRLATTKHPADAIFATPLGNQLVFDLATAALAGEQLGLDATPDLLVLSLSAHDYVGHGWGHESWEAWDMMLRLDAQLAAFLDVLDARVGAGAWAMIVTSDHGAAPLPERGTGGRVTAAQIERAANRAATTELGAGTWIAHAKFPNVYLSAAARRKPPKVRARVLRKIAMALRSFPGIERVERTDAFAGECDRRSRDARTLCRMLDPERSGELFYLPRAGWTTSDEATAHGSSHAYDREVPLILVPFGRVPHPPPSAPTSTIEMTEIAPLIARWLGIPPPAALAPTAGPPTRRP